ncbi:MAG: hypothetical protein EOO02_12375 [Chitinophagaceae bacterium]|nr:MAG: hypothetical protein EOO02_12375 [Chitinophagaceae bacterium]
MKPFLVLLTILTLGLAIYFTVNRENYVGVNTYRMYDGNNSQTLKTKGKILFNDDESGIESMSLKGFLDYTSNDFELYASAKSGKVIYELTEGGKQIDVNSTYGKSMLADLIKEILSTGFDARGRLDRLYAKAGSGAVLEAASKLKHDHMKAMYFRFLIEETQPSDSIVNIILAQTAKIGGDYEKSGILKTTVGSLNDTAVIKSFFAVANGIESEFERANVLKKLIKNNGNIVGRAVAILDESQRFEANFEKDQILNGFSDNLTDSNITLAYLRAVKTIDADFEKKRSIERVIKNPMSDTVFTEVMQITATLQNSFETSNLLKKLLEQEPQPGSHFSKILLVVHDIDGEFERTNLLQQMAEKQLTSDEQWTGLITEASFISNDSEKAKLLTHIASKMPRNESIKNAFEKSAKTINSEFEYGRALKAAAF